MIGHSLIHRCTVQRRSTKQRGYGSEAKYDNLLTSEHCRLVTKAQKGFNSITGQWVVTTNYLMLFQFGANVMAGDRVTGIVDESGAAISGNFEIEAVIPRRSQVSRLQAATLNKVS